jgi:hypothetical protein
LNTNGLVILAAFEIITRGLAELDLRSTPVQILLRHAANQNANFGGSLRPTARARPQTPSPVKPKSSSVPTHHGVRLNNDEGLGPLGPDAAQNGPKQPVDGAQLWSRMFSFEHGQLLTQGEDRNCSVTNRCGGRLGLRLGLQKLVQARIFSL